MSESFAHFSSEPQLEGFLCPMCKLDLKTPDRLTAHFDAEHFEQDDQDLLQSFRGILLTAKKKIRNEFGTTAGPEHNASRPSGGNVVDQQLPRNTSAYPPIFRDDVDQSIGVDMDHSAYFTAIRSTRLERFATETNKLIIRLHKLLTDRPADAVQRRQHEQSVSWNFFNLYLNLFLIAINTI